jgi:hypothetical protein
VILAGCLIAALTHVPLFGTLAKVAKPTQAKATETVKVEVAVDPAKCG